LSGNNKGQTTVSISAHSNFPWHGATSDPFSENRGLSPFTTLKTSGYADGMGMPGSTTSVFDWVTGGRVTSGAQVITRPAPGIGVNAGGNIEAVVSPGGVQPQWFHMP